MLKKNLVPAIVLGVLVIIGAYYFFSQTNTTLKKDETAFLIRDTTAIELIEIRNPQDSFQLSREQAGWVSTNHYYANSAMMRLCFKIFTEAEIQSVLSSEMAENAKKILTKEGARVQVFLKTNEKINFLIFPNKLTHQVYVMPENKEPFIINLPSYQGNFAALFFTKEKDWRDNTIVHFNKNVESVEVKHLLKTNQSFKLGFEGNKAILSNYKGDQISYNQDALNQYLLGLHSLKAENFSAKETSLDSLKKQKAYLEIEITYKQGNKTSLLFYSKGKPVDLNEAYVLIDQKEMAIVKYVEIDPIAPEIDFFK